MKTVQNLPVLQEFVLVKYFQGRYPDKQKWKMLEKSIVFCRKLNPVKFGTLAAKHDEGQAKVQKGTSDGSKRRFEPSLKLHFNL